MAPITDNPNIRIGTISNETAIIVYNTLDDDSYEDTPKWPLLATYSSHYSAFLRLTKPNVVRRSAKVG